MLIRWLVLILVVLNALVFLWGYQRPGPTVASETAPLSADLPTITLLSEVAGRGSESETTDPAEGSPNLPGQGHAVQSDAAYHVGDPGERVPATEGAPSPDAVPPEDGVEIDDWDRAAPTMCVRLGPFDQQSTARDLVTQLRESGHRPTVEVDIGQEQSGYWVLIPPGAEDEEFVIANLELAGIHDVWRFTKGELAGAVSLGLYSDWARAEERLQDLVTKGFQAEIRPREVAESMYWVTTIYQETDGSARTALEQVYNRFPTLNFPPTPCADIAAP